MEACLRLAASNNDVKFLKEVAQAARSQLPQLAPMLVIFPSLIRSLLFKESACIDRYFDKDEALHVKELIG
jgi:hypothetical protein